jgi:DNA-binding NarL/FixJ family response regulator
MLDRKRDGHTLAESGDRRDVAVVDPCPARRLGIAAALARADLPVEELESAEDLVGWLVARENRAAVLSIAQQESLETLRRTRAACCHHPLVALSPENGAEAVRAVLLAGATGAGWLGASVDELVAVVAAALRGKALLDASTAAALARGGPIEDPRRTVLTTDQRGWLRALARGATVAELADSAAFSERAMYRQLHELYERIGAQNRTQALLRAADLGLLDDDMPAAPTPSGRAGA